MNLKHIEWPTTLSYLGPDVFLNCEQLDFSNVDEDLLWHFPNAFPQHIVAPLGYVKPKERRRLELLYQKNHDGEKAPHDDALLQNAYPDIEFR